LENIPALVMKDCSNIFVPVLKYIFNRSLSLQYFYTSLKQAAVIPLFEKVGSASVSN
jgi:hypothetical protein